MAGVPASGNQVTIDTGAPSNPAAGDIWIQDIASGDGHIVRFYVRTSGVWHQQFVFNTAPNATDQTARDAAAAAQTTADGKIDSAAAGALIAAHTSDADAHHVPGGGGGGQWYWTGHVTGGTWTAGSARTANYRPYPIGPYADYASLRAAIVDGSIAQVAVRISQNDADDADDDHGTSVHPNISGFQQSGGTWRVFPGHALNVDPVGFTVTFAASNLTVAADAAIQSSNTVVVRVAVWA